MPVYTVADRQSKELFPGAVGRTFWGDKLLLNYLDLAPGCVVPRHSHPHEQAGIVIEGELEFVIGDETHTVKAGDIFVIPGNVEHSVTVGAQATKVLDIFSPVREDYQW